jgi:hypothetical protein
MAKECKGHMAGLYILGPNKVNGKSHWLQDSGTNNSMYSWLFSTTNAIWCDEFGFWNIGAQDKIGLSSMKNHSGMHYSSRVAGPQEAKNWTFFNQASQLITSDDILVQVQDTFGPDK